MCAAGTIFCTPHFSHESYAPEKNMGAWLGPDLSSGLSPGLEYGDKLKQSLHFLRTVARRFLQESKRNAVCIMLHGIYKKYCSQKQLWAQLANAKKW